MRARHKAWAEPFLHEHPELVIDSISLSDPFFSKPLALEIGSGKGDFLISLARKNPQMSYLALERDISICGIFAKKVLAADLQNIRLICGDFDIAKEMFLDLKFSTIYLNFSDPWPKKRHEKRRLTAEKRLREYLSLLEESGLLRFKSDNDILYTFTQEELAKVPEFEILVDEADYIFDEENDAMSEYERNFREQGQSIHRIIAKKK